MYYAFFQIDRDFSLVLLLSEVFDSYATVFPRHRVFPIIEFRFSFPNRIELIGPELFVGEPLFQWVDYQRRFRKQNEGAGVGIGISLARADTKAAATATGISLGTAEAAEEEQKKKGHKKSGNTERVENAGDIIAEALADADFAFDLQLTAAELTVNLTSNDTNEATVPEA